MSVPRSSVPLRLPYVVCAVLTLLLAGCATDGIVGRGEIGTLAKTTGAPGPPAAGAAVAPPPAPAPAPPREIPGLGPRTRAAIPAGTRQAFVVTGESADSNRATAVLYTRTGPAADWRAAIAPWPAHNALNGWTGEHWEGDLRSPVGVFTLTAAGGRLDPPATAFPYDLSPDFRVEGEGFHGEPLEGSFDYVIAIDYNRVKGTPPNDPTRPEGQTKGGSIWLHMDHGSGTSACVSLPKTAMEKLLRTLDPKQHPVVVMGDRAALQA